MTPTGKGERQRKRAIETNKGGKATNETRPERESFFYPSRPLALSFSKHCKIAGSVLGNIGKAKGIIVGKQAGKEKIFFLKWLVGSFTTTEGGPCSLSRIFFLAACSIARRIGFPARSNSSSGGQRPNRFVLPWAVKERLGDALE